MTSYKASAPSEGETAYDPTTQPFDEPLRHTEPTNKYSTAAVRAEIMRIMREAIDREREIIANEARHYAGYYQEGTDGRNTFILLAEWIEKRMAPSTPPEPKIGGDVLGHKTRFSDSSLYDEVCVLCGATDGVGDYRLKRPCPKAEHVAQVQGGSNG